MRARVFFGNEARQFGQIVAQEIADAESVNGRKGGIDRVGRAALVVQTRGRVLCQRFIHAAMICDSMCIHLLGAYCSWLWDDFVVPVTGYYQITYKLATDNFDVKSLM